MKVSGTGRMLVPFCALFAASPAAASDFTEVIVTFVFGAVMVGAGLIAVVFALRSAARTAGPLADALTALTLAGLFAPAVVAESPDGDRFTLLPRWIALLGGGQSAYLPCPLVSFLVTSGMIYFAFAKFGRRSGAAISTDGE
jgi:hypothetical protein